MSEYLISSEEAREDLLACAAFLAERIRSSDGHGEAVKAILPFYLRQSEVDTAAALADSIADPFTRDRLLIDVVERCVETDDDEYAFQLVEAIEERGFQAQARERIALGKSAAGDDEKAFEIAATLEHPDNVYAAIAFDAAGRGDAATSDEAIRQIEYPLAKAVALAALARAELEKGDRARSVELLETAAQAAADIDFTEEKIRALADVANHFTEAGRADRAIETLDRAKTIAETLDNVHREAFLSQIAAGFFHAGSVELADRTLDLIRDKTQIASTLLGFARDYGAKGESDDALESLEEAYAILKSQHEKETRDSRARFALYAAIAAQFARFGRGERAIEIAQEIPDENEQMSALAQIAATCAALEKDETARLALAAIGEERQKASALIAVSDAKRAAGKSDEALAVLDEAFHQAGLIPQLTARSSILNLLARRYADHGRAEKARNITHENFAAIAEIRDQSTRAVALAALAEVFEEKGFTLTAEEREILAVLVRKAEI